MISKISGKFSDDSLAFIRSIWLSFYRCVIIEFEGLNSFRGSRNEFGCERNPKGKGKGIFADNEFVYSLSKI